MVELKVLMMEALVELQKQGTSSCVSPPLPGMIIRYMYSLKSICYEYITIYLRPSAAALALHYCSLQQPSLTDRQRTS